MGGKTYYCGRCSDAFVDCNISLSHPKRVNKIYAGMQKKRKRSVKTKKHLEKLHNWFHPYRAGGAYKCYSQYYPNGKVVFYKRDYRSRRRRCYHNYIKRYANRKVRYYRGGIKNGSNYKRIGRLQWAIRE